MFAKFRGLSRQRIISVLWLIGNPNQTSYVELLIITLLNSCRYLSQIIGLSNSHTPDCNSTNSTYIIPRLPTVGSVKPTLPFVWSRLGASAKLSTRYTTVDSVLKIGITIKSGREIR